jgi:hypothetical protein
LIRGIRPRIVDEDGRERDRDQSDDDDEDVASISARALVRENRVFGD